MRVTCLWLTVTMLLVVAPCGAAQDVTIARLQYGGGDWYADPGSLANWLAAFNARTGVKVARDPATVTLDSEDLYNYPFLYATGHGHMDLSDEEVAVLRRYLDAGGFLYVDDNYGLDRAFRQLMARVFPRTPLQPVGADHPVFHSFYDLPGLPKIHEHDGEPAQAYGIEKAGRLLVFYTWSSDIGDGLEDPNVHGDTPASRDAATRMAVNILMYALTRP
jgi:uncharacterized protein DUF4159